MSNNEAFTISYRPHGHRRWQKRDFTAITEAMTWIDVNLTKDDEIYLYENNVWFRAKGQDHTGDVIFWWSTASNEEMGQDPQGRGFGWSDDHECYVRYEPHAGDGSANIHAAAGPWGPHQTNALTLAGEENSHAIDYEPSEASDDYEMVACYVCGKRIPQNLALADRVEVLTARSSGTTSTGYSHGHRTGFSSRGSSHSNSSRSSVRRSSGRKFYKIEQVFFCSEICQERQYADTIGDKPLFEQALYYFRLLRKG